MSLRCTFRFFNELKLSLTPLTRFIAPDARFFASGASEQDQAIRQKHVNRLIYRSKQRGLLELDLLVGEWAETMIPQMDMEQLKHTERLLDEENPDLWKWLTGQETAPQRLQTNSSFQELHRLVMEQMGQHSPVETRAAPGAEWVRGWDDGSKDKK